MKENLRKCLAELIGTLILVYAIASAAVVYSDSGQIGVIGIGLVHALVLTALVYSIGYVSGAHVNPAVTIGFMITRRIRIKLGVFYIISQIIGGIIGATIVFAIFGSSISNSVTLPSDGDVIRTLITEVVMSFTLVLVVLCTTSLKNDKIFALAGVAIGFTLGFNVIFGGSITGGSLNPARSFGPALVSGNFDSNWVYWVAPIIGALIAAATSFIINGREPSQREPEESIRS
jgi:MIP family channel proteins